MSTLGELSKKRATSKGHLTRVINKLDSLVNVTRSEASLNFVEANEVLKELGTSYEAFTTSHQNYEAKLVSETNEEDLEKVLEAQNTYFQEVTSKFYSAKKSFTNFQIVYNDVKDAKEKLPSRKMNFKYAVQKFNTAVQVGNELAAKIENKSDLDLENDPSVRNLGATGAISDLKLSFDNVLAETNKLSPLLESVGCSEDDIKSELNFDVVQQTTVFSQLITTLDKIVHIQSRSPPSVSQQPSAASMSSSTVAIKLAKAENITFSGDPRDFATFKKDFEAIVMPNRPDYEVGVRLRQAIPSRYKHLISNIDLADHAKMMDVLAGKFGTARQIVMHIMSDFENLKVPSDDKEFVTFVEKIEKADRDLTSVGHLGEIQN